jgi:hypothetical protein
MNYHTVRNPSNSTNNNTTNNSSIKNTTGNSLQSQNTAYEIFCLNHDIIPHALSSYAVRRIESFTR